MHTLYDTKLYTTVAPTRTSEVQLELEMHPANLPTCAQAEHTIATTN